MSLALLVSLGLAPVTQVQGQQPLSPGQRVRVTAPSLDLDKHTETFRALRGDTLVLESMWLPLSEVARLDMYAGRHGHPWRGAAIGGVVGGAVGFISYCVFAGTISDGSDFCAGETDEVYPYRALVLGIAGGALIGAAIGAAIKTDRWKNVPLDRLRVSLVPQRDGRLALGLAVSF